MSNSTGDVSHATASEPIRRFPRLLKGWTLPGWILVGWTMVEQGSNIQFLLTSLGKVSGWLGGHPLWGLLAGFLWLTLVVLWPEIRRPVLAMVGRHWVPPESIDHRLRGAEDTLRGIADNVSSIPAFGRRLLAMEAMLDDLAIFSLYLSELTRLLAEAGTCIEMFQQIRDLHPGGAVAEYPFSSWRPHAGTAVTDDATKDGIRWARYVESHVEHLHVFCLRWKIEISEICKGELFTYIGGWRHEHRDVSADLCLKLFQNHYEALNRRRDDHVGGYKVLNFLTPP